MAPKPVPVSTPLEALDRLERDWLTNTTTLAPTFAAWRFSLSTASSRLFWAESPAQPDIVSVVRNRMQSLVAIVMWVTI